MKMILLTLLGLATATGFAMGAEPEKLSIGVSAPDFEVTNADGKTIKLSERLKSGRPIVLMFSRAKW